MIAAVLFGDSGMVVLSADFSFLLAIANVSFDGSDTGCPVPVVSGKL